MTTRTNKATPIGQQVQMLHAPRSMGSGVKTKQGTNRERRGEKRERKEGKQANQQQKERKDTISTIGS